jgi:hypothetical protein
MTSRFIASAPRCSTRRIGAEFLVHAKCTVRSSCVTLPRVVAVAEMQRARDA